MGELTTVLKATDLLSDKGDSVTSVKKLIDLFVHVLNTSTYHRETKLIMNPQLTPGQTNRPPDVKVTER